jgi:serine/threonine-protein kinase
MSTPSSTPDAVAEADLSGRRLGDYQLLRRLGRGGMAEVYLAEQLSLRRQVAFKVLRSNLALDPAYVRRFHNEAQAAANLVHANIVQIHEVGNIEGIHYIAQEYVPGQNLKQLLTRRGKGLDTPQAVAVIRQVAAALHKAAEQSIIHRDIKPENIMLSNTGEVKVADFGLARIVRDREALNLTQVGITMGTPLYMSPEQVEGKAVDPRSDIYCLGVTCYQMLAGHPPFEGDTALADAVQHLKNEPRRLETLRPDLPEGLCRIVHRMLAKKPDERYQKASDLLRELRALKIEGDDHDWIADVQGWSTSESIASSDARTAATQQLALILQQQPKPERRTWPYAAVPLLVLLAFPIGGLLAWFSRPAPLLEFDRANLPEIERFESVEQQYLNAQFAKSNVEEAWHAVAEYFPPGDNPTNLRYSRLAKRALAGWYLSEGQLDEALALYRELTNVEETEVQFRICGLAGEAVVYDRLDEPDQVASRLPRILATKDYQQMLDGDLRSEMQQLARKYAHPPTTRLPDDFFHDDSDPASVSAE